MKSFIVTSLKKHRTLMNYYIQRFNVIQDVRIMCVK